MVQLHGLDPCNWTCSLSRFNYMDCIHVIEPVHKSDRSTYIRKCFALWPEKPFGTIQIPLLKWQKSTELAFYQQNASFVGINNCNNRCNLRTTIDFFKNRLGQTVTNWPLHNPTKYIFPSTRCDGDFWVAKCLNYFCCFCLQKLLISKCVGIWQGEQYFRKIVGHHNNLLYNVVGEN